MRMLRGDGINRLRRNRSVGGGRVGLKGAGRLGTGIQRIRTVGVSGRVVRDLHRGSSRKAGASQNQSPELRNADPSAWVTLENAPQDGIEFRRQGQNGTQELGILEVGSEGRILNGSTLPRVPAAREVHQDDPQAPHVIGSGEVTLRVGRRLLALWTDALDSTQAEGKGVGARSGPTLPGDM